MTLSPAPQRADSAAMSGGMFFPNAQTIAGEAMASPAATAIKAVLHVAASLGIFGGRKAAGLFDKTCLLSAQTTRGRATQ